MRLNEPRESLVTRTRGEVTTPVVLLAISVGEEVPREGGNMFEAVTGFHQVKVR